MDKPPIRGTLLTGDMGRGSSFGLIDALAYSEVVGVDTDGGS